MDAIRVQDGASIDYTCTGAVAAGDVIQIGDYLVGIASTIGATGEKIGLSVSGVFDIHKDSSSSFTAGDKVYWVSDEAATAGNGSSSAWDGIIGYAVADAATADSKVRVLLGWMQ
jgi:predicted RecA/RadA family phage recombinase